MWKRAILVAGALLVALVGVVFIGGALFPRTHVASSTLVIGAPVDSVWPVVRDFEGLPAWWDDLERVETSGTSEGAEVWTQYMTSGPIVIAVASATPPRQLVTRIVADESAPFGGTWTYDLASEGAGTRVTITEDGYINNLFFRFVSNVVVGVHGTMDSYLRDLAMRFGSAAEPQHVQ